MEWARKLVAMSIYWMVWYTGHSVTMSNKFPRNRLAGNWLQCKLHLAVWKDEHEGFGKCCGNWGLNVLNGEGHSRL